MPALLFFTSLVSGTILAFYLFTPLHGRMGLNFVAVVEPYFQRFFYLRLFQQFITMWSRYLFLPFFIYLGYRITRAVLLRISAQRSSSTDRLSTLIHPLLHIERLIDETSRLPYDLFNVFPNKISKFFMTPLRFMARLIRHMSRFLGRLYMLICLAVISIELIFFCTLLFKIATHPTGAIAFYQTCNKCHGFNRPFNFNHSASIWDITVDRMVRHSSQIPDKSFPIDKRENIIEFLCSIRSYSDKRLVRSKCYTCHTPLRIFNRQRAAGEWRLLVERIQRENPFYITPRQADQLVTYFAGREEWTRDEPRPESQVYHDLEKKLGFEKKCGTCHTLDVIFMEHIRNRDWGPVLKRMGEKEPDFLSSNETISFLPVVEKALENKEVFHSSYPHSAMRERFDE